jgi:WD40 repeat protein
VATISPDGQLIAAADATGGPTFVWNLRTGTTLTLPPGELGVFGPESTTLPIGIGNETVLYNARTGHPGPAVPSPGGPPNAVLSPDGRRIAVTEQVRNAFDVVVYDLGSHRPVGPPLQLHGNGATPVGFLPDGRLLTSGSAEAALWTIARRVPQLAVPLPAPGDYDASVFMPASDEVVTGGAQFRDLVRHSERTGTALGPLLSGDIQGPIVPSPDGKLIAAAVAHHEEFGIWSLLTGKRLTLMPDLPFSARLAWSPNGRQLAADFGPSVQIWDVTRPDHPALSESIPTVHGVPRPDYLLFSPDSRRTLTAETEDRRLTMSDIARHHVRWSVQINDLTLGQVAFSPNGDTVAVNSGDPGQGHVTLYSSATGKTGPTASIQSIGGIGYLHGGRWLVVTAGQSAPAAQLYDAANLQQIGIPFPLNGGSFGNPLATNPAGTMFSEAENDTPLLWDTDPTRWQATACRIAGRNLTQTEWREYIPSRPYQTTCPEWPRGQ